MIVGSYSFVVMSAWRFCCSAKSALVFSCWALAFPSLIFLVLSALVICLPFVIWFAVVTGVAWWAGGGARLRFESS
jgi:hypothetical protein